ncbi:MAG: acyl-protein synthetase [Candidatus Neomarinimicrobiota bacterium]
MDLSKLFNSEPYSLTKNEKKIFFDKYFFQLIKFHYLNCVSYKNILDSILYNPSKRNDLKNIPFLPSRLFKTKQLFSISENKITNILTSSGTSGQQPSKIFLDKSTVINQKKVLMKIVHNLLGQKRLPMLIIDSVSVLKKGRSYSARGAGILGFSTFGKDPTFVLNEDMSLNYNSLDLFLEKYNKENFFIFGFTYMIHEYFVKILSKNKRKIDLSKSLLIHGGGWKKMEGESLSKYEFKNKLLNLFGIKRVHDYYGMVEQTGSIFIECKEGYFHSSIFSDIYIRRPIDFSLASIGEKGLIQLISTLPISYPGFSILTEDIGIFLGVDDCRCGRFGKYFQVEGRVKNSELRGCSDTYEA